MGKVPEMSIDHELNINTLICTLIWSFNHCVVHPITYRNDISIMRIIFVNMKCFQTVSFMVKLTRVTRRQWRIPLIFFSKLNEWCTDIDYNRAQTLIIVITACSSVTQLQIYQTLLLPIWTSPLTCIIFVFVLVLDRRYSPFYRACLVKQFCSIFQS